MENSQASIDKRIEENLIKNIEGRLIRSIMDFSTKVEKFEFTYEIKGEYIFGFMQGELYNNGLNWGIWRMICYSSATLQEVFFDGNVGKRYTIEDCKVKTKSYVNSVSMSINNLI